MVTAVDGTTLVLKLESRLDLLTTEKFQVYLGLGFSAWCRGVLSLCTWMFKFVPSAHFDCVSVSNSVYVKHSEIPCTARALGIVRHL